MTYISQSQDSKGAESQHMEDSDNRDSEGNKSTWNGRCVRVPTLTNYGVSATL